VRLLISGYFFSWFVWGVAIPTFVFGTDRTMVLTREWLEILRSQPAALYWSDMNQSAWMSVLRWIGGNPLIGLGVVSLLGGYLMGCLTTRNLKSTPGRDVFSWLSPWLILTQLLNPLAWRWGSVFLVGIPFAVAGLSVSREKNIARTLLMGGVGVLWLLQLNPVVQRLGYHHWSEMHQYGLLTAYWFILLVLCLDRQFYWPSGKSSGPDAGSEGGGAAFSASA
jgi:hypothetical protein